MWNSGYRHSIFSQVGNQEDAISDPGLCVCVCELNKNVPSRHVNGIVCSTQRSVHLNWHTNLILHHPTCDPTLHSSPFHHLVLTSDSLNQFLISKLYHLNREKQDSRNSRFSIKATNSPFKIFKANETMTKVFTMIKFPTFIRGCCQGSYSITAHVILVAAVWILWHHDRYCFLLSLLSLQPT